MKNIYSKLNNNDGKTILMALFLLLVAVVVSVVVITAASTAAHQLNDNKEAQQAYLTVSSAAQLFRDEISKEEQKYVYTAYEYYWSSWDTEPFSDGNSVTKPKGELSELLTDIAKGIMEGSLGSGESEYKSGNININSGESKAAFDDVSVKIYIQYAGTLNNVDNYDMDITFEASGKSNDEYGYKMNLYIPITKQVGTKVKEQSRIKYSNGYYYTCYVTTTTTTITFGNGTLTRDGINADGGVQ